MSTHAKTGSKGFSSYIPGIKLITDYERSWWRYDIVAALSLWAILVPQAMAYAQLAGVPAVGDSIRDLEAARAAKASPILVKTGKGRASVKALRRREEFRGIPVFEDLAAFANDLLHGDRTQRQS